ncbi:MAG: glycosyltransferase [Prevotella sp.]|nr:glycosyltransferase [Prevotella sp.]
MKILFFITGISLKSGGPSQSVPFMAKGLAEAGADVTLMTRRTKDMNTGIISGTNVHLYILEKDYRSKEVEDYIKKEKIQLIQIQSIWSLKYHQVAKIARELHIPYIVTPRGMLEPWSLSQKRIKKKIALWLYQKRDFNKATCIYTTAKSEADNIKRLNISSPCAIIPNSIDVEQYPCRDNPEIVKKRVLFLSRIHIKKGVEILLDAWRNINIEHKDWELIIAGNGDDNYIQSLKNRIIDYKIENCVKIIPPVFGKEKVELYQSSSLFILPSYSENFGMVIAEAMSCGVPVITTNNTPWEIVNNTNTGWCIPLSVSHVEETLKKALSLKAEILYEMGQKASALVRNNFDYRIIAKKNLRLYDWIINKGEKPDFVDF